MEGLTDHSVSLRVVAVCSHNGRSTVEKTPKHGMPNFIGGEAGTAEKGIKPTPQADAALPPGGDIHQLIWNCPRNALLF